jgi:hypothetical protein
MIAPVSMNGITMQAELRGQAVDAPPARNSSIRHRSSCRQT